MAQNQNEHRAEPKERVRGRPPGGAVSDVIDPVQAALADRALLREERDAALADVERLRGALAEVEAHAQIGVMARADRARVRHQKILRVCASVAPEGR